MSNAYSDATRNRNQMIENDIKKINYIYSQINKKEESDLIYIKKMFNYGTTLMIINTINNLKLYNYNWELYNNNFESNNVKFLHPCVIKDLIIPGA